MTKRTVPLTPPAPGMSAAVQAGGAIYVAGQVALGPDGLVGDGDCEAQARQCFGNVDAVLGELGVGLADVVSLTAYLADPADAPAYLAVRRELFAVDPPATTTVIAALLDPRFLVEVQVVAAVPGR
jgi:enamine deaminase RidA (YjgF/YER057c/UK114 family)